MEEGILKLNRDAVPDEFVLLRSCSSLVRKSASGHGLELAHFTVKEFLLGIDCDNEYSTYRVDVKESEVELGKVCLTYLTLQDFNSRASSSREAEIKRHQDYAFRIYANKHWLSHAGCRQGDPGLLALIKRLLDPSKPGTFTTWTHDFWFHSELYAYHGYSLQPLDQEDTHAAVEMDTPLHYASGFALPEICKWLLDCGCEVNHIGRFGTPINYLIRGPASPAFTVRMAELFGITGTRKESRLEVLDILLEAGADPNSNLNGFPPLYNAQLERDVSLRLLERGARYTDEHARRGIYHPKLARKLLNMIGRENLHKDDYAFLLQCGNNDECSWRRQALEKHMPRG